MIRELDHLCYEGRLRELELFCLEKRWLWGELINSCQYLWGGHQEDGTRFFSDSNDRTRGNRYKFKTRNFHLNIRKSLFPLRATKNWKSLSRDLVETPPLKIFQTWLENDPAQSALGEHSLAEGLGLNNLQRYFLTPTIVWSCDSFPGEIQR